MYPPHLPFASTEQKDGLLKPNVGLGALLCLFSIFTLFFLGGRRKRNDSKGKSKSSPREKSDERISNEKDVRVLHPYLLAIFPALSLVSDHIALFSINRPVIKIATWMSFFTSLGYSLSQAFIKNAQKAGAIVSGTILLFSTYGYVFDFLSSRYKKINHKHLFAIWAFLEISFTRFILNTTLSVKPLTEFLNILSGSLVTLSLFHVITYQISKLTQKKPEEKLFSLPKQKALSTSTSQSRAPARDIYYLIIDGHASTSALCDVYGYDNRDFANYLQQKGFFIAEQSQSNYSMTMLSLASSLNGDYVHALTPELIGTDRKNLRETQDLIENNFSMRFLKEKGYKIVFLGSGFGITQNNRHADLDIQCGQIDEPTGRFIQSTLIRPFADRLRLIENDKRQRVLRMFSELGKLPQIPGPKFVFAHIPSPQWPFLFDAHGNPTFFRQLNLELKKKAYLNQLVFIDKKIKEWVNNLTATTSVEPIIVIQSDHGPNFAFEPQDYTLQTPHPELLREKMQILNAYYLPGCGDKSLYASISPVNTFRLIFNQYFDTCLPLLEDQSYFSTLEYPYLFTPLATQNPPN